MRLRYRLFAVNQGVGVTVYAMKRRVSQHKFVNYCNTKGTFQHVAFQQSSASVCTKPCVALHNGVTGNAPLTVRTLTDNFCLQPI